MAIPASVTQIDIGGHFVLADGTAADGTVSFTPSVTAATAGAIVPAATVTVRLVDGAFSVALAAPDDPDWVNPGWVYVVEERIAGCAVRTYNIEVPADTPGGELDLATLAPVVTSDAISAYLLATRNLSDLTSASTARTNLGLGDVAVLDVGTTAGTVAAGDSVIPLPTGTPTVGQVPVVADDDPLTMEWATVEGVGSSVTSVVGVDGDVTGADILADATVSAALGAKANESSLGTAAAADTTDFDAAGAAAAAQGAAIAASAQRAANLSDLASASTARGSLGLGGAAVLNVGTTAGTVAAGNDARLTDARTPTAHAASHGVAGADPVTVALSQVSDAGTAAAADTTDFDAAGAASSAQSAAIAASAQRASNLADLASARTARTNLGLTAAAATAAAEPPLSVLLAALASRSTTPCRVVFAGSSTTAGTGASDTAHAYVWLVVDALQSAYPSGLGSEAAVIASQSATWGTPSTDPGVHGYNMGHGGTTSANYFTADERTSTAALAPACIVHMIGANDFATGVVPATYGTDVAAVVNGMKALVSTPMVQVLVHTYQRMDVGSPAYPWSAYLAQLQAIADADPDNVVCIDASAAYASAGVPGSDPWNLINVDNIHQGDTGHALTAELLWRSLVGTPRTFGAFAPLVEAINTVAESGATETLPDPSVRSISRVTLTAACTFTFPTATAGKSFTLVLVQGGTGSYTVTWPGTAVWEAGTAPTLSTAVGAVDVFMFLCVDGSTWMGFPAGLDMS